MRWNDLRSILPINFITIVLLGVVWCSHHYPSACFITENTIRLKYFKVNLMERVSPQLMAWLASHKTLLFRQGAVHKRRPQSGGGGLSSADMGGSSDAGVRTFWWKETEFSKFMVCPHEQAGGVDFSRFWADVLYGRPPKLRRMMVQYQYHSDLSNIIQFSRLDTKQNVISKLCILRQVEHYGSPWESEINI